MMLFDSLASKSLKIYSNVDIASKVGVLNFDLVVVPNTGGFIPILGK